MVLFSVQQWLLYLFCSALLLTYLLASIHTYSCEPVILLSSTRLIIISALLLHSPLLQPTRLLSLTKTDFLSFFFFFFSVDERMKQTTTKRDPNLEIGSKGELVPRSRIRWEPFNLRSQYYIVFTGKFLFFIFIPHFSSSWFIILCTRQMIILRLQQLVLVFKYTHKRERERSTLFYRARFHWIFYFPVAVLVVVVVEGCFTCRLVV